MAILLSEYEDLLEDLGEQASEVLEANWHEATRVFTPRGLQSYLEAALCLKALGRGVELGIHFI